MESKNLIINCKKCGNWEEHPIDEPRHKTQYFELLEWLSGEIARLKCRECDTEFKWDMGSNYQNLFNLLIEKYDLILLNSEMDEIVKIAKNIDIEWNENENNMDYRIAHIRSEFALGAVADFGARNCQTTTKADARCNVELTI